MILAMEEKLMLQRLFLQLVKQNLESKETLLTKWKLRERIQSLTLAPMKRRLCKTLQLLPDRMIQTVAMNMRRVSYKD